MRWCWRAGEVLGLALLLGVLRLSLRWFLWASTGSLLRVSLVSCFCFASLGVVPAPGFGWGFDCSGFGCVVYPRIPPTLLWSLLPLLTFLD